MVVVLVVSDKSFFFFFFSVWKEKFKGVMIMLKRNLLVGRRIIFNYIRRWVCVCVCVTFPERNNMDVCECRKCISSIGEMNTSFKKRESRDIFCCCRNEKEKKKSRRQWPFWTSQQCHTLMLCNMGGGLSLLSFKDTLLFKSWEGIVVWKWSKKIKPSKHVETSLGLNGEGEKKR